jgi:hypothetical protein
MQYVEEIRDGRSYLILLAADNNSRRRTLTTAALFVAVLARTVPTASRHTVRERPERKNRREQRMSIRHRVRRG